MIAFIRHMLVYAIGTDFIRFKEILRTGEQWRKRKEMNMEEKEGEEGVAWR